MNGNNNNNNSDKNCKTVKDKMTSQQRSLTPAILGIPSVSHGAKLPPNMNSKEKYDLLMKLEEFRQARRGRLIASVLAKGKQSCNSEVSTNLPKPKPKTKLNAASGTKTNHNNDEGQKTVFERLYENAGKQATAKLSVENKQDKPNNIKKPQNVKPLSSQIQDKKNKLPKIVVASETDKPGNNPDQLFEKVILADSVVEEEIKTFSGDSQHLKQELQEVAIVNENTVLEQQAPLLAITSQDAKDGITEESGKVITSNDMHTVKENKEKSEECSEKFQFRNFEGFQKDLGLKKSKSFRSERKFNPERVQKAPLRRSISMIFRKKIGNPENAIHRAQSEHDLEGLINDKKQDDISKTNTDEGLNSRFNQIETGAHSVKGSKTVSFLTPKHNPLNAFHLRNKLENWLVENGHSIETYKHLRCFGLSSEEVKFTPYRRPQKIDDSINNSFYSTAPNTPMSEIIDESDKENVTPPPSYPRFEKVDCKDVEGWLSDLHQLIVHVKYPSDRCEEWLNAISKKFPGCAQLPMYWECVAAMNGNPGDVQPNKEQEENKSGQNDQDEDSLAELLDKLVIDEKCKSASKIERGLSVKNIFKSKTVKFAIKEKAIKQSNPGTGKEGQQKVLVATPVRRSARLQTPNKTDVIMSLSSLDPETKRSLSFKPNEALLAG